MLVDIIMPAYNPGPYITDALKSCMAQEYKDFTVTVIDDCSEENVEKLVSEFPGVRYIRADKNAGPAAARNLGIENTSGDLISLLDADDIMHPKKLKLSVDAFRANNDIGLVCGNYRILVNRRKLLRPFYRAPISVDHNSLMHKNLVASGSTTFKRSALDSVGLFDERYWICEDYDMWIRIAEVFPIHYLHNTMYYYSVIPRGDSLTQRDDIQLNHNRNIIQIKADSRNRMLKNENKD